MSQVSFQDYKGSIPVRTSTILTNSYVAGQVIGPFSSVPSTNATDKGEVVAMQNQLIVKCRYTKGNSDSASVKIEFSDDNGVTWDQETFGDISAGVETDSLGTHTLGSGTGNYRIPVQIKDGLIKVSVKGNGADLTGSLLEVVATVGTA